MKERKYQNGQVIINTNGSKFLGEYDLYKIVIYRKEKPKKTDTCVKYVCGVYFKKEDKYGQTWVLRETLIDTFIK